MHQRLDIARFLGSLIDSVEARTGISCYDSPENKPAPLYSIEVSRADSDDNKTMCVDVCEVLIHCISRPTGNSSKAPVLRMVKKLREAFTEEVEVGQPVCFANQSYQGLQTVKIDASGEGHAVTRWRFEIAYGLRNEVADG